MKFSRLFLVTLISSLVRSQAAQPQLDEDWAELVFNVTLNGYEGLCNACVFGTDYSVYMINSPYCLFDWESQTYNIAEEHGKGLCFYDDPRFYDIECYSKIANNTLDCTRMCPENTIGQNALLQEGGSYELEADSRCMYRVDWWNKGQTGTE